MPPVFVCCCEVAVGAQGSTSGGPLPFFTRRQPPGGSRMRMYFGKPIWVHQNEKPVERNRNEENKSMNKITPFLWFESQAEEAMNFYLSVFKNSRVIEVQRQGENGPVSSVVFELDGQQFMALNAGPHFKFNEAISFYVNCETQEEVDELWAKLTADGGEEGRCGWLKDKFGLSWQIIPRALGEMLADKDPERARRVFEAMMQMNKIEIAKLEQAYEYA